MTAYDNFAQTDDGQRRLARARLRYRVLGALHRSLEAAEVTKSEVARRLGIRKSAVGQVFGGDGNLRVNTIADYFDALGYEVEMQLVPKGTPRAKAREERPRLGLVWDQAQSLTPIDQSGSTRPEAVHLWNEGPRHTA